MRIHDLATLISLAAQHPRACVKSHFTGSITRYHDHAECFATSETDTLQDLFQKMEIVTDNSSTHQDFCEYCSGRIFEQWPEELCASTTSSPS